MHVLEVDEQFRCYKGGVLRSRLPPSRLGGLGLGLLLDHQVHIGVVTIARSETWQWSEQATPPYAPQHRGG
eukprot:6244890-Amphidinium_carterae.1